MNIYRYIYQIIVFCSVFMWCSCTASQGEKIEATVVNIPVSADSTQKQGKMPEITFEQNGNSETKTNRFKDFNFCK